jgi:hypothetical protein
LLAVRAPGALAGGDLRWQRLDDQSQGPLDALQPNGVLRAPPGVQAPLPEQRTQPRVAAVHERDLARLGRCAAGACGVTRRRQHKIGKPALARVVAGMQAPVLPLAGRADHRAVDHRYVQRLHPRPAGPRREQAGQDMRQPVAGFAHPAHDALSLMATILPCAASAAVSRYDCRPGPQIIARRSKSAAERTFLTRSIALN